MLAGSTVLFALTMGLLALVALRPSWAARVSPGRWMAWGGLGLPALVLPPLVAYSFVVGERMLPNQTPAAIRIEAEGFMWGWDFTYPDQGGLTTRDRLHLPAGLPVDVAITSRDVIHSFWVPRLAGKLDAIPGHVNVQRLVAGEPGTIAGQCAEFCGAGHTVMKFEVIVHPPEDFAAALAEAGS